VNAVPGRLVAFEGIDRAGKSSLVAALPPLLADSRSPVVVCAERQSPLGPLLESQVLSGLSPFLKTYFFAADRAWVFERVCEPALTAGRLVLWDRYVDSAVIYRSIDLKNSDRVDLDFVRLVNRPFPKPALTVYVDISEDTSLSRAIASGAPEPYDVDFLRAARREYLEAAHTEDYMVIDGERPTTEIVPEVAEKLKAAFPELFYDSKHQ
jgi:dTMP kinase